MLLTSYAARLNVPPLEQRLGTTGDLADTEVWVSKKSERPKRGGRGGPDNQRRLSRLIGNHGSVKERRVVPNANRESGSSEVVKQTMKIVGHLTIGQEALWHRRRMAKSLPLIT